jgi:sulfite reductase alpha subunit-like flavoprotein
MTTDISPTLAQSSEQLSIGTCASANWSSNGSLHVEKRRETRYPTCEPVEVYLLDMNNLRLSGMLKDISKSGMRIELDMPLKPGDRLEVVVQNKAIAFAEVRYCRRTGESYQVGILIEDVYYPKAAAHSSPSNIAVGETQQVTHYIRFGEKRSAVSPVRRASETTSKGVFNQFAGSRHREETASLGAHLNRSDIDNLLRLKLSETKAALLERHMMSCDQCLDLLLRELEERAPSPLSSPKNGGGQI